MINIVKLKAAIIGLGQVGQLFDFDEKREGVWTHFSSYEYLSSQYDLISVCDIDEEKRNLALKRKPSLRLYTDFETMITQEKLDVVSICTPPDQHGKQIGFLAGKVKAIICEKPLDLKLEDSKKAIDNCEATNTVLAVNYYKRFEGCVPQVKELISDFVIGEIETTTIYYSGPLYAVGSHAVNLLEYLVGELIFLNGRCQKTDQYDITFQTPNDTLAHMITTGPRKSFTFETDIIGSKGRIRIINNNNSFELYQYKESKRYSGYLELEKTDLPMIKHHDRFIPMFEEVYKKLQGEKVEHLFHGKHALKTQILLDQIEKKSLMC